MEDWVWHGWLIDSSGVTKVATLLCNTADATRVTIAQGRKYIKFLTKRLQSILSRLKARLHIDPQAEVDPALCHEQFGVDRLGQSKVC